MRQSVSVTALGCATAALLVLVLAIGVLWLLAVMPAAGHLLQHADAGAAWAQLSAGQQGIGAVPVDRDARCRNPDTAVLLALRRA